MLKEKVTVEELRDFPRLKCKLLEFADLNILGTEKTIRVKPIDISPKGVGFNCVSQLFKSDTLAIGSESDAVQLKQVWSILDRRSGEYRYGYRVVDNEVDLFECCIDWI